MIKLILFFFALASCTLEYGIGSTVLNNHVPVEMLHVVSLPVDEVVDTFSKNIFAKIEKTYGPSGIGMDHLQVQHLKKTYLYLIFLAKLEKVKSNAMYMQYLSDFQRFLNDNRTAQAHMPDTMLLHSAGWASVKITEQDLVHSAAWQLYVQSMIADSYAYFAMVLEIIHNVEQQTFNYMPHFEVSFYDADYTQLRTLNEMSRARLVLEEEIKNRFLKQCDAWSVLPSIATKQAQGAVALETLESAIVQFRGTEFYKKTHDFHAMAGINSAQSLTNQAILSTPSLQSPLKEYVWCYLMLYEASGQITAHMNQENLESVLAVCSSSGLQPNLCIYSPHDFIILDELLSVKSKAEGTHILSPHPSPVEYHIENIRKPEVLNQTYRNTHDEMVSKINQLQNQQVQAQGLFSFFRDIGHDIEHAFEDVAHAVEKGFDAVKNFAIAIGVGIAGIGAELVGQTAFAHQEFENEAKSFNKAVGDLNSSLDDFTKSLEDGIEAPVAQVTGDLVGFILNDQKLGRDVSSVIASVDNSILQVVTKYGEFVVDSVAQTVQAATQAAEITSELSVMVATSAWAIFSKNGQDEFLKQGADLGKLCLESIAQAYTTLKSATMAVIHTTMMALGVITNALTTIFIDISREITYLFTGGIFNVLRLGSVPGLKEAVAYSQKEADHVTSVLTSHRAVINTVMGVVACIAVDVATGGAAVETNAAIIGDAAAETTEEAIETTADIQEAQDGFVQAQNNLKTLQEAVADGKSVSQEELDNASERVADAQKALDEVKAAQAVKTAATVVAKKTVTQSLQDFGKNIAEKIQQKVADQINSFKTVGKNIAKAATSFSNIIRSGKLVEEATADIATQTEELKNAQEAFDALPEDALAVDKAQAQQTIDNAKVALQKAQDLKSNADELQQLSTWQKAKRLGSAAADVTKSTLSGLMEVIKPLGYLMNVAFNMGNIIAGANQDAKNALDLETQTTMMQNLWKFYNDNRIASAQQQESYLREMNEKVTAQIGNQSLSIALSSNVINAQFLEVKNALESYMAPLYVQMLLQPSTQQLALGNIGSLWNLNTGYINLYPSQGFFTATTGRPGFSYAQEIAQAPEITNRLVGSEKGSAKLWFNQKCSARDDFTDAGIRKQPDDVLSVQCDIQILYTLQSTFYTGIYLAGNYHDYNNPNYVQPFLNGMNMAQAAQAIFNPQAGDSFTGKNVQSTIVDLDEAHLAKMVVLYRDGAQGALMLGIYEHEGLGWVAQEALPDSAQLDQASVYTLQVTLDQNQLDVTLFIDYQSNAIYQQTVTVTPSVNQRTYGMIVSGASISWNQIVPIGVINQSLRPKNDQISEIEREKKNKILLDRIQNPVFGSYTLKPLSKQAILLGQYVYATQQTDLAKILPDSSIDFVVFGSNVLGAPIQFGLDPVRAVKSGSPVLISLITGTVYNDQAKAVGTISDVWKEYQQFTKIQNDKLDQFITSQKKLVEEKIAHVTFGSFNLDIATNSALKQGWYVYTCDQTLTTAQGDAIINPQTKKSYQDIVVCANFENNQLLLGLSPASNNANALYSLVTGNVFAKNTVLAKGLVPKVLNTQSQPLAQFGSYVAQNNISQTDPLYQMINQSIIWYASYQPTQPSTTIPQAVHIAPAVVAGRNNLKDGFHFPLKGLTLGMHSNVSGTSDVAIKSNLSQRQKAAAGKVGFQVS